MSNDFISSPQGPVPYHPQSRFGSGVMPADVAYPNLCAYYGKDFQAHFTTLDLLDSLAARQKLAEDTLEVLQQPHIDIYEAMRAVTLAPEPEAKLTPPPSWRIRFALWVMRTFGK